jgi:hypothetical protein
VLERFALSATAHEIAERGALRFGNRTIEEQIKINAAAFERGGKQVLCIETRVFHPALLQKARGRFKNFENAQSEEMRAVSCDG